MRAPIAAASGSGTRCTGRRPPACSAASRTARCSTLVTPAGMQTITSGFTRLKRPTTLCDEVAQHRLGDQVVGDDAVAHRADDGDAAGHAAHHLLRLAADGDDGVVAVRERDDRRLVDDDAAALDVDEHVRRAEVDSDALRKHAVLLPFRWCSADANRTPASGVRSVLRDGALGAFDIGAERAQFTMQDLRARGRCGRHR